MHLYDANGEKVKFHTGIKICYDAETKNISFSDVNSQKLYFKSHEDNYYLGPINPEQFYRIAWLLVELSGLHIQRVNSTPGCITLIFSENQTRKETQ